MLCKPSQAKQQQQMSQLLDVRTEVLCFFFFRNDVLHLNRKTLLWPLHLLQKRHTAPLLLLPAFYTFVIVAEGARLGYLMSYQVSICSLINTNLLLFFSHLCVAGSIVSIYRDQMAAWFCCILRLIAVGISSRIRCISLYDAQHLISMQIMLIVFLFLSFSLSCMKTNEIA